MQVIMHTAKLKFTISMVSHSGYNQGPEFSKVARHTCAGQPKETYNTERYGHQTCLFCFVQPLDMCMQSCKDDKMHNVHVV
jgi:hypothetical protein